MLWDDENKKNDVYVIADDVVDLSFRISCKQIPTMHAEQLFQAISEVLPWIGDEPEFGIHQVHGADTGNGWERPADDEIIHLSKRTRMTLRVKKDQIELTKQLTGSVLNILDSSIEVGEAVVKLLNPLPTIFSRFVIAKDDMDEEQFIQWVVSEYKNRNITLRKLMCGISHQVKTDAGIINTRSVMIADLDKKTSMLMQEEGLGDGRQLGCGIFLPHKGINAVDNTDDKSHFTGT